MRRVIAIVVIITVFAGIVWVSQSKTQSIVISEAVISPTMDGKHMAGAIIANLGEPDVLLSAQAKGFEHSHFMGGIGTLVIPGGSAPILAGDGAHVMLSGVSPQVGQLVPLVLTFQSAGKVSTQARIASAMMDHSNMAGIETPEVTLDLQAVGTPGRDGLSGRVEVEGVTLIARASDASHVPGEGHAHVYLNGLKLQRLYGADFATGTLLPGNYNLTVTLNGNDHRPYIANGEPISASLTFTVE